MADHPRRQGHCRTASPAAVRDWDGWQSGLKMWSHARMPAGVLGLCARHFGAGGFPQCVLLAQDDVLGELVAGHVSRWLDYLEWRRTAVAGGVLLAGYLRAGEDLDDL